MGKKKTIFLDIDGVLATHIEFIMSTKKFRDKNELAKELSLPYPFNKKCVKIFNEILDETDADIVLSSDWRIHWNLEQLDKIFKFNGVKKSPIDVTGRKFISMNSYDRNRVAEINEYKEKNDVGTFVVIDDMGLDIYFMENFVKTKDTEGIKQLGIKNKILKILQD